MLNEPAQGGGGQGGGGAPPEVGGGAMNYIQVTPQEKEAIERVGHLTEFWLRTRCLTSFIHTGCDLKPFKTVSTFPLLSSWCLISKCLFQTILAPLIPRPPLLQD